MTVSKIEWTDRSDWNPIRGCTRVSPGCGGPGKHGGCYAEAIAARFSDPGQPFHGFAERTSSGPRWTGKVEVQWDRLTAPLGWRKPARIFASSMADWFHEALPAAEIASLFAVAVAAVHLRGHTIQILTKRADRMREILESEAFWGQVNAEAGMHVMERTDPLDRRWGDARATLEEYGPGKPPPGIWLGVSAEDQRRYDERRPQLEATPAAVRFWSLEPLLGGLDLGLADDDECYCDFAGRGFFGSFDRRHAAPCPKAGQPDWVIAGGESGPRARPVHPDWARSIRDQCAAAGVPFFFKQWGEWAPGEACGAPPTRTEQTTTWWNEGWHFGTQTPADGRNGHGDDEPDLYRVGKRRAGRTLDGRTHDGMPGGAA
ncbi:hypothetical protein STAQ_28230 [Allostella sp. ATCC 35155]|nr:hypothetical protein STAQ_28230 [Stella sp. ATCC 35155]